MILAASLSLPIAASGALAWPTGLVLVGLTAGGSWLLLRRLQRRDAVRRLRELGAAIGESSLEPLAKQGDSEQVWCDWLERIEQLRRGLVQGDNRDVRTNLLQNESRRLRAVFQALPTGVLVLRGSDRVLYANEVASRLLCLRDDDEPVLDVASENSSVVRAVHTLLMGDLARGVMTERVELESDDEGAQVYRVRLLAHAETEEALQQDQTQVLTFEDITSEESTQRMKTEFVYGVSHELKTPLTSIQASLEMLVEDDDLEEEDRQRLLDLSYSETIRLGRMVRELLDLARVEAGVTEVHRKRVVVKELMDELHAMHHPLAARKSIEMTWSISDFVPTIVGDRDLLLQAFVNLIGNAIKYTHESGRVDVTASVEGEELMVKISDTGIGIPEQDLDKIFDKFYRASTAKKTSIPGTGLGLPMARFIIETHGGRIEVESVEGEGSTFTTYFPSEEAGEDELDTTNLRSFESIGKT